MTIYSTVTSNQYFRPDSVNKGLFRSQFYRVRRLRIYLPIIFAMLGCLSKADAQQTEKSDTVLHQDVDIIDVFQGLFQMKETAVIETEKPSISLLPIIGYNPSFGGIIGINTVMGKQFGDPATTDYSVFNLSFTYSTSGVTTLQSRHNMFRPDNEWNFQGNWQFSLYGIEDFGLGTGETAYCNKGDGESGSDSIFPIRYNYLRLTEKIFYQIKPNVYVGGGISLNIYGKIDDINLTETSSTPHSRYSLKHGYDPDKYSASGLLFAFQYNTREHPIRSYGGIYFDFIIQFNQKWLGSTTHASVANYDFRKYWSLSKRNPAHVIALWHWATYRIGGNRPYLDLPFTGSDTYNRSGRAYKIGRFRGPSYAYFETEYRYPILRNNLIGGVLFANFQTAGNDAGEKVFHGWNVGGGAGLRFLFQKRSRSALCVDFSWGNCGSSGVFFGLNEVF